jgi:hypothetical protein
LLEVRHAFVSAVFGRRENCKTQSRTEMTIIGNAASWSAESRTLVRRVGGSIVIVLVGAADPDTLRSDSDSQLRRLL